jgi:hypothetical protein
LKLIVRVRIYHILINKLLISKLDLKIKKKTFIEVKRTKDDTYYYKYCYFSTNIPVITDIQTYSKYFLLVLLCFLHQKDVQAYLRQSEPCTFEINIEYIYYCTRSHKSIFALFSNLHYWFAVFFYTLLLVCAILKWKTKTTTPSEQF